MRISRFLSAFGVALGCMVTAASALVCSRESREVGQFEDGSIECLVDETVSGLLLPLGFEPKELVSTKLVAATLGQDKGSPSVAYVFHYRVSEKRIDLLIERWATDRPMFAALAEDLTVQIRGQVCSSGSNEAAFFAAGGRANILIVLTSWDRSRKKLFNEPLAGIAIDTCEAP